MSADNISTRDVARSLKDAGKEGTRQTTPEKQHERAVPMFSDDEAGGYRTRWDGIQTGFVDEPRRAVEEADALVAQVIKRLSEVFADERTNLEKQWGRGDQISTEDLRVALRKYRSFFERLLTM